MNAYRACNTAESDVGMRFYLTPTSGTGGRLKKSPDDFIVKEISDHPEPKENGRYVIAEVTTRNWETNRLIRLMARNLGVSREKIGFAGTKDKRAITTQLMSFEMSLEKLNELRLDDVTVRNAYLGKRPLQIGDLVGNSFEIKVRECDTAPADMQGILDETASVIKKLKGFPNYFGVQRFGVIRPVTHRVGEAIVRGDLEGAVRTYLSFPSEFEEEDVRSARQDLDGSDDWSSAYSSMPDQMSFEKTMVGHLAENPGDWMGAIAMMPKNLQMMFVHAYQSYLFNIMLSRRMESGMPLDVPAVGDIVVPLNADRIPLHENPVMTTEKNIDLVTRQVRAGRAFITITLFGSESIIAGGEMGEIEMDVIGKEGLKANDFVVPGLNHCSSKGSRREILCPVKDLSYRTDDDGYAVSFSLPKGNYATCLMREFMKSDMKNY